jgi:hypothetical protein
MRYHHLKKLGYDVMPIDMSLSSTMSSGQKIINTAFRRLGWPRDTENLNASVIDAAGFFQPNVMWVDKGVLICRETLSKVREQSPRVMLVHYNPDDPFGHAGKAGWRRFINAMSEYDVHFVPRRENLAEYKELGCQHVIHNIPTRGFDPFIHRPYQRGVPAEFACELGFLGAFEKERAHCLRVLAEAGFSIRLKADWPSRGWQENFLRAPFEVRGEGYARAIGSFKIGLGFLRKINRDQHTSRSIEIPACGTFLLAERTEEHLMLFEEGKEAEFFSNDEEMISKVQFYLSNDELRETIARRGRQRCLRSGYDYASRMQTMINQVMELAH